MSHGELQSKESSAARMTLASRRTVNKRGSMMSKAMTGGSNMTRL